jgi:hypothetical protein
MTFELKLALRPGASLTISGQTVEELCEGFADLGGDKGWLHAEGMNAVEALQHGTLMAPLIRVDGASIGSPAKAADVAQVEEPDQPSYGEEAQMESAAEVDNDPWGVRKGPRKPAASTSAPSRATSRPASQPKPSGPRGTEVFRTPPDRFGRVWTINLPNAPECDCGEPAAQMKAKSQKTGSDYVQWRCAKEAPGGDFHTKCAWKKFPNEIG